MNSTSKQCPECTGEGKIAYIVAGCCYTSPCSLCKGAGTVPAEDPPTAGSVPPAVIQPALRSLPVPPNVLEVIDRLIEEARRRERYWRAKPETRSTNRMADFNVGKVAGLLALLETLSDTEHAGPEANTDYPDKVSG
jgi:hypothetical protein